MNLRCYCAVSAGLALAIAAPPALADAVTYSFFNITGNRAADAAIGEAQLAVTIASVAGNPGQVDFIFTNTGPNASSITDVYFDDGTLLAISQIFDGPVGVDFEQDARPGELPGRNNVSPPFTTSIYHNEDLDLVQKFNADTESPTQPNGVNPGEMVTIRFDLIDGQTWADTIAAINNGFSLRIGIHVQGFGGGGSESFVNEPTPVPVPGAVLLGLVGLGGIGWIRRRFACSS